MSQDSFIRMRLRVAGGRSGDFALGRDSQMDIFNRDTIEQDEGLTKPDGGNGRALSEGPG